MDSNSVEWKDFELSVELHKSYLEFIMKLNLFHYAVTGAILSFHFSKESPQVSIFALLLPIILSMMLGIFFLYCTKLAWNLRANIKLRAEKLGLQVYPEGIVLVLLCAMFGIVTLGVGLSLTGYLVCA